ncbi:MAG: DUF1016 family protein [Ignavibacteriales bacterium]|nr:DUF1016 family protein [Ignavibacteriales bacterium]
MNFELLLDSIKQTHSVLQQFAGKAVNRSLTIRNWLIGFYIVEFEQKGEDRAQYGDRLLPALSKRLNQESLSLTNLKLSRQFYQSYPQIGQTLPDFFNRFLQKDMSIFPYQIGQTLSDQSREPQLIRQTSPAQSQEIQDKPMIPVEKLVSRLSFSHFVELIALKDPLQRTFYELECLKGNWSVRELHRQINSLYFERSGMSRNPDKLSLIVSNEAEPSNAMEMVKSVYAFEFIGLKAKDVLEESDLESALLDHLQEFLVELGHGFCFEARQKKILIGDEYFFVDLVFYHRILKCHVLIELKVEEFSHANVGQLNTYVNYYKQEVMRPDDNLPVGILLVTNKNDALVQYALAGMDNNLFVSKYLVELPGKKQLEDFVKKELQRLS